MPPSHARQAATGTLLVAIAITTSVALTTYKAATAPITYDEAYTYLRFARKHTGDILSDYQFPNNHILHTLAVRISTRTFGDALWAVRLPGLLGGLALLAGVVALARRFDDPIRSSWPIAVAFLPVVMEYNGLARGYSLGAAACFWAALMLIDAIEIAKASTTRNARNNIRLVAVGALLGVAVGCVPTFGILAAGILAAALLLRLSTIRPLRIRSAAIDAARIALGVVPVILVTYGRVRMKPGEWPWGHADWQSCVRAFWEHTLAWPGSMSDATAIVLTSVVIVSIIVAVAASVRKQQTITQFLLATFVLSIASLICARWLLGTVWPLPRTIHWAAPFCVLVILLATASVMRSQRAAGIATTMITLIVVAWGVSRFDIHRYAGWEDNAAIPAAIAAIDRDATEHSLEAPSIAAPWQFDVCIEYAIKRLHRENWILVTNNTAADYAVLTKNETLADDAVILFDDEPTGLRSARLSSDAGH